MRILAYLGADATKFRNFDAQTHEAALAMKLAAASSDGKAEIQSFAPSVPAGWEHINLTGDYLWRSSAKVGAGKFRPLRPLPPA